MNNRQQKMTKTKALQLAARQTDRVNNSNSNRYAKYVTEVAEKALLLMGWSGTAASLATYQEGYGADHTAKEIVEKALDRKDYYHSED
jgi:hypothetical protein